MSKSLILNFLVVLIISASCTVSRSQNKNDKNAYNEDLSSYRPKFTPEAKPEEKDDKPKVAAKPETPVKPQNDVTRVVNLKLDSLAVKNRKIKLAQGYRILVYTGTSSEEAKKMKEKVYKLTPTEEIYTIYKQPTFRVKVGDYYNRLEANHVFVKLQKDFPNAMLVPDQVNIEKEEK